jgi:hypothetical protein
LAKELDLKVYSKSNTKLHNIFGDITQSDKATDTTILIENIPLSTTFLIVKTQDNGTILLGNDTLEKFEKVNKELKELKEALPKVFDMKISDGYTKQLCTIETKPNKRVYIKQKEYHRQSKKEPKKRIDEMLNQGIIEKSKSSWCSPIRPVLKPDGKVRITTNM